MPPPSPPIIAKPPRGAFVMGILVFAFMARLISIFAGLLALQAVAGLGSTPPIHAARRFMMTLVVVAGAQLLCLVGVWGWKKWGVYGYVVTSALAIVAGVKFGSSVTQLAGSFVGAVLMLAATLPRWRFFED